jgi:hypothetical protein
MKYMNMKMLGLSIIAVGASMAFAGSASATVTGPTAGTKPTTIHYTGAVSKGDKTHLFEMGFANITCTEATLFADLVKNETLVAKGPVTALSFSGCGSAIVKVVSLGEIEIVVNAGGGSAYVKGYNWQITFSAFGTSCTYGTSSTGTIIGPLTAGAPAINEISASVPKISGGFLCANPARWTGQFTVTSPSTLLLED